MSTIRIATRASALALAQARWVAERLSHTHEGLQITFVEITTTGDADRTTPVTTLTEVGAFVRSVQMAVLEDDADLAVHSCKDLPVNGPDGLVAFYPERESPWDVICGSTLEALPSGARVGTGSPRRSAQLSRLRPDLVIEGIRGNIDTRLAKAESGEYAAVVLAEAGLLRTGRQHQITQRFGVEEMVPAPGQGALAVEAVASSRAADLMAAIDDPLTRTAVEAERSLLARTGAGCRSALGAITLEDRGGFVMHGFVEDGRGARRAQVDHADASEASRLLQQELGL